MVDARWNLAWSRAEQAWQRLPKKPDGTIDWGALEQMLTVSQLTFEDHDEIKAALADVEGAQGDVSDFLVGRANQARGCSETVTFDQSLKGHDAFRVLG